ncbi:MAG: hypothetical protein WBC44_21815 [Planctomycetaceae bacterium]
MKTLTILVAGLAAAGTVRATAQDLQRDAFHRAEQAHAAAAELAAIALPHAHCTPDWDHVAREAVAADKATEAVLAALAACDFCTARDVADRLNDIADDLQDDVEDLEPAVAPFPGRFGRQELRRMEQIADVLEEISGDLRRDTRRLDERQVDVRRVGPPPVYTSPVPVAPPLTTYPAVPGRMPRGYETIPYAAPPRNFGAEGDFYGKGYPAGSPGPAYRGNVPINGSPSPGALGPSLNSPPSDAFGPTLTPVPHESAPSARGSYYGVSPTAGTEPQPLPPGLSRKSKVPPGHSQKIQQRPQSNGPALLGPSAEHSSSTSQR